MSTYLQSYRDGTASVANGSTAVTGALTLWAANVQPGDRIVIGATEAEVASVTSNTALVLVSAWGGATATGANYVINRWSKGWSAAGTTALLLALYESNRPSFIPVTGTPSNAVGADGNIAVDWTAGLIYQKAAGVWGNGVAFRLRPRGAYGGATAYLIGDVVTDQSASWVNLTGSTGAAPPALPTETNANWSLLAKSGELTRSGAVTVGRPASWISNTQLGDIGYTPRETLSAARTYYVATTGSDANNGLSAGSPFATLDKAWQTAKKLDLNGFSLTISLAEGTYTTGLVASGSVIGGSVTISGAGATTIVSTSGYNSCFSASNGAKFKLSNLTLTSVNGASVYSALGGEIEIGAGVTFGAASAQHMRADTGGVIKNTYGVGYAVSGGANWHIWSTGGAIILNAAVVTVTAPITVSAWVSADSGANVVAYACSAVNASNVTGQRYTVTSNAVITTYGGGASYFPGTTAGSSSAGGVYS